MYQPIISWEVVIDVGGWFSVVESMIIVGKGSQLLVGMCGHRATYGRASETEWLKYSPDGIGEFSSCTGCSHTAWSMQIMQCTSVIVMVSCVTSVHVNWGHEGHPCFHSSVWIITHHYLLLLIVDGSLPAMAKRKGAGEYWCVWEVEHGVNIAHLIIYCVVTPFILFNCE